MNSSRSGAPKPPVSSIILDSSATLALLQQEAGADTVHRALDGAIMSSVNASEVLQKLLDPNLSVEEATADFRLLPLHVLDFTTEDALEAALLREPTKAAGLSFGDRACLALARRLGLPVLTGDRDWLRVSAGVEVRMIR